jgi:hypothetical protein
MNHTPHDADRAELARLLPAPAVPELPADRHRRLKDTLLDEIGRSGAPAGRWRPRWLVPLAAAGLTAIVAVILVSVLRPTPPAPAADGLVTVVPGDRDAVLPFLERLAAAAAARPAQPIKAGQFVYLRSRVAWPEPKGGSSRAEVGPSLLATAHDRETWSPQSTGVGLIRERGTEFRHPEAERNQRFTTLPADPDALLRRLSEDAAGDAGAFAFIGTAVQEAILPPAVAAALYRAAAKIPDIVLIGDSVDTLGRHGPAVAHTDDNGVRHEWIFDPATLDYRGERAYLARDTAAAPAGTLTWSTAVVRRAVVDRAGEVPR